MKKSDIESDSWTELRSLTNARIALGKAGSSLPTQAWLEFRLAHARARDAVWRDVDLATLERIFQVQSIPTTTVESLAPNMHVFLRRPDLGRTLHESSEASLLQLRKFSNSAQPTVAIIVSGGLSADAIEHHAVPTTQSLTLALSAKGIAVSHVVLVRHGRVAIGDPIGHALGASATIVLIGERPGLDSPDSLGAYLTFAPSPGKSDADRNCVSNIHGRGLPPEAAAHKLAWLTSEALVRQLSGVALKDESPALSTTST